MDNSRYSTPQITGRAQQRTDLRLVANQLRNSPVRNNHILYIIRPPPKKRSTSLYCNSTFCGRFKVSECLYKKDKTWYLAKSLRTKARTHELGSWIRGQWPEVRAKLNASVRPQLAVAARGHLASTPALLVRNQPPMHGVRIKEP